MKKITVSSLPSPKFLIFLASFLALLLYIFIKCFQIAQAENRKLPIYSVETDQKVVSLTFDSAWGTEDLDQILKILSDNQVCATFFVTGDWVNRNPEAVKKIYNAKHEIGNHGDCHKHMSQLSQNGCSEEIQGCHQKVRKLLGFDMHLFRAPYGEYNNTVVEAGEKNNYYVIQWDVDSLDWKNPGTAQIINTTANHKNLKNGSILLMHNGTKYTKDALEPVIKAIKQKGYQFIPLSKLLKKPPYTVDSSGRQQSK